MKYGLNIRQDAALDLVSLGALVHRLDPGIIPFRKATACQIHVSGGEFNVAANLADCFRLRSGIATAMVDYPVGDLIAERVRAMGVKPFYKTFKHDGVQGPNMATVYSDRGQGVRAPVVFYNRCNEDAAQLKPGDFDWGAIFAGGLRWFHSGGIFAALSPTTAEVILEGMQAAQGGGGGDFLRPQLPGEALNISGGHDRAVAVLDRIVKNVDVLVGNEEDLQLGLGIPGPEVAAKSKLDPSAFCGDDRQRRQKASADQDRGDDPAGSAIDQPSPLERRRLDRRQDLPGAHVRPRCARSRRGRRRLCVRILLRLADGSNRPRKPSSWAGLTARC